jgi:polysaccharide chain length determinant protein (PEP-CTERM system associated)
VASGHQSEGHSVIPNKQYTPEVVLAIAWRRKWWVLVPALVIATVNAAWTRQLPNLYQAEALILVVPQRVPENYARPSVTASLDGRLTTISQQMFSRTRLERIIADFNLYPGVRTSDVMEDIVKQMRGDIIVEVVRGDVFRVGFTSSDPRTAMQVSGRLASLFIDENLHNRESLAEVTNRFLDSQLEEARRQLIENEQKLEVYRRQHDGQLPSQVQANLEGLHNTEMQLQALTESSNRDRDRRLLLERVLADVNAADASAPPVPAQGADQSSAASDELLAAEANLREMQLRLTPEHPDIQILKRQIVQLQKRVQAEEAGRAPSASPNATEVMRRNRVNESKAELENLDQQIAGKVEEEKRLRGIVAEYQRKIEAAPTRETELADLTRDYDTFQQVYRDLLAKKADSKITANLERRQIGEQFEILDSPRLPERPAIPNRPRLYLMGLAAGLAVGFGLAALLEYFDRAMRSEDDVRAALNLLVVATVPVLTGTRKRHSRLVALSVTLGIGVIVSAAALAWRFLK